MSRIAAVAVHVGSAYAADILYSYRIPDELSCTAGHRVFVPFGKSNKSTIGFVMKVRSDSDQDQNPENSGIKLKLIQSVPDEIPVLSPEQLDLVRWLRENTFCTYYDALKAILPSQVMQKRSGRIRKSKKTTESGESANLDSQDLPELILSSEQQKAYDRIAPCLETDHPACFLLKGVTGSGKTSVFEKLAERTLTLGKSVLLLLPEISLTPQIVQRFRNRFGGRVALMHSRLSDGERRLAYERARTGDADFIIGTRSAVFAPLRNLGLIIMDEEGEQSYKSDAAPRYDTIEVAKYRCRYHGAVLVPASATPKIESYYNAKKNIYQLVELNQRYGNAELPEVEVIDMRAERADGNQSVFSRRLFEALRENLQHQEQSILLLNRRGYHTIISCCICNQPVYCENCSIPMTWHKTDQLLHCHYCGFSQHVPETCPSCNGTKLRRMGFGTQKLEEELAARLPDARILRMDADTTGKKNAYEENFEAFRRGEYDIMLGTQMIGKGLDFPNVTLVGVVSVDKALFAGDFKSYERTFSLVTQVVGRSGRAGKAGYAILQTFMPDHYVLRLSAQQNYEEFAWEELSLRKMLLFPPYCDICVIGFTDPDEEKLTAGARKFAECMRKVLETYPGKIPLRVLGPVPCTYGKIGGKYRWRMILKCKNTHTFRQFMRETLEKSAKIKEVARIHVYVDMNGSTGI
ncbi:MAG: primosomal protein N' [Oscillospiraceae bacterium]|nr:primosomal protein N' [Oscillospiraceae bacterium]